MWFKIEEARDFLLKNGFVFTLRPKRRFHEGWEILSYDGFGKKGIIFVVFVREVENGKCIRGLVRWSGFETLEDWLEKAGESRFLYVVFLKELTP